MKLPDFWQKQPPGMKFPPTCRFCRHSTTVDRGYETPEMTFCCLSEDPAIKKALEENCPDTESFYELGDEIYDKLHEIRVPQFAVCDSFAEGEK